MPLTVSELAARIGATVRGDTTRTVSACAGLEEAGPEQVSFLSNPKYAKLVAASRAGAIIVSPDAAPQHEGRTLLVAADPYFAFREAVVALHGYREQPLAGISDKSFVDPTATLGEGCSIQPFAYVAAGARLGKRCVIYPHCYVGPHAVLGDDCILYPNVTVYDHCVLGNRVVLHAGCSIGQDGFGYATHQGAHHKIPQIGIAVLEDDVEMGANCAIDRATVGATRIGQGTKFSDLVAIGHGCTLGRHNLLVAQVGIAGSSETGDYVVIGGQTGVAGHLRIGHMVRIAAQSGVAGDIPDKEVVGGAPAMSWAQARRHTLALSRLPDMVQEFRKLKVQVQKLEAELRAAGGEEH